MYLELVSQLLWATVLRNRRKKVSEVGQRRGGLTNSNLTDQRGGKKVRRETELETSVTKYGQAQFLVLGAYFNQRQLPESSGSSAS